MWLVKKKQKGKCDGCSKCEHVKDMSRILDTMYFCNKCVENMLTIFVYTNAIKILCPHCGSNNDKICKSCNLDLLLETVKGIQEE